jgi:hypothetical protein
MRKAWLAYLAAAAPAWAAEGLHQLHIPGPPAAKYDLLITGDGFAATAADQELFQRKADEVVKHLRTFAPLDQVFGAFNLWRLNLESPESGISHPRKGIVRHTRLGTHFGREDQPARVVTADDETHVYRVIQPFFTEYDSILVLVNDPELGGSAAPSSFLVYTSLHPEFLTVVTHELGHRLARLADEYSCYLCDGKDDGRTWEGNYEPDRPNVTAETLRERIKWPLTDGVPTPTTGPHPPDTVGVFEGAYYYAFRLYRPQQTCHMRTRQAPFCRICRSALLGELAPRLRP